MFSYEVLEECAKELLTERERHHINACGTLYPLGFNLSKGGGGPGLGQVGMKRSPRTCANISAARLGQSLSSDHRAKISAANRGRDMTACTAAAADVNRGRKVPYRPANPEHVLTRLETRAKNFKNKELL
jgi:hypothetical protein